MYTPYGMNLKPNTIVKCGHLKWNRGKFPVNYYDYSFINSYKTELHSAILVSYI